MVVSYRWRMNPYPPRPCLLFWLTWRRKNPVGDIGPRKTSAIAVALKSKQRFFSMAPTSRSTMLETCIMILSRTLVLKFRYLSHEVENWIKNVKVGLQPNSQRGMCRFRHYSPKELIESRLMYQYTPYFCFLRVHHSRSTRLLEQSYVRIHLPRDFVLGKSLMSSHWEFHNSFLVRQSTWSPRQHA